ncbi:MAG: hypothetical protein WCE68_08815 [Anaerolineales bacterium]
MKTSKWVRLAVAFLFIAALFLQVGQPKTALAAGSQASEIKITPVQRQAALAHWTRSAIAKAKPFPMPVDKGNPGLAQPGVFDDSAAFGAPGRVASRAANPAAVAAAQKAYAADWQRMNNRSAPAAALPALGSLAAYSEGYANYWSPAETVYPNVWVGQLVFDAYGQDAYCSATVLDNNVIVTAAHCVFDTTHNNWYSSWVFVPAYANGNEPFGEFPANDCWVLNKYIALKGNYSITSWTQYDVAVCSMDTNGTDTLNDYVGYAGYTWNYNYDQSIFDLGYPFEDVHLNSLPYPGEYLMQCEGETFQKSTGVLGMGCDWGPGISGGPWLKGYSLGDGATSGDGDGYVDSVNSGLYIGKPGLYGIRFTSANIVSLCMSAGCY